jgi:short chain dehydrogenase
MSPARRERIEREAPPKIHHRHDRPAIRSQYLAPPIEKVPADYAGDSDERDSPNQEVSACQGILGQPACGNRSRGAGSEMMRQGWGRIVNVTTSLGTMLNAGNPTYGPSKAALEALSAIMAKDLRAPASPSTCSFPAG